MRPARISEKNTVKKYCNFGVQLYPMYLCVLKLSLYRESQKTHFQRKIEVVVDNNYWKLWLSLIPTKLIDCCSRCVSLQDSNDDSEIAFFWDTLYIQRLTLHKSSTNFHFYIAPRGDHESHLSGVKDGGTEMAFCRHINCHWFMRSTIVCYLWITQYRFYKLGWFQSSNSIFCIYSIIFTTVFFSEKL